MKQCMTFFMRAFLRCKTHSEVLTGPQLLQFIGGYVVIVTPVNETENKTF